MHGAGNYSAASSRTDQSERSGCGGRAGAERVVRRALAGLAAGTARTLRQSPKQALPRDGIIFVCAAGVRSESAARLALQNGLTTVYNLSGGTKNWVRSGLSLVQD